MNYLAALIALIITAVLVIPILKFTNGHVNREKEKCFSSMRKRRCHVVAYILRSEPYADTSEEPGGRLNEVTFERVKESIKDKKNAKHLNEEEATTNRDNWVSIYQYNVDGKQYEYRAKRGKFMPNIRLCYEEGHPEEAEEEAEIQWQSYVILSIIRFLLPILLFSFFYATLNIILHY